MEECTIYKYGSGLGRKLVSICMSMKKEMKPKIFNLTPHPVVLVGEDTKVTIPPSGGVVRLKEEKELLGIQVAGFPVYKKSFSEVSGLPENLEKGDVLIVSGIVAEAVKENVPDSVLVVVPNELIRDTEGNIIGAKSFWTPG